MARAWTLGLALLAAACAPLPKLVPSADLTLPEDMTAERRDLALADPTALAFDAQGRLLVVEGRPAGLWRVEGQRLELVARASAGGERWVGAANSPIGLLVATDSGRLLNLDRQQAEVAEGLSLGGLGLRGVWGGPEDSLYVSIGAGSNAGLPGGPHSHESAEVPCQDATLAGQPVAGRVPCSGAILRRAVSGGDWQVVAWGFRAAILAPRADGSLFALDQPPTPTTAPRPLPPLGGVIWAVTPGVWYGWPNSWGDQPLPQPVLGNPPNPPPTPLKRLEQPATALAAAPEGAFGGQLFYAQSAPLTVRRLDPDNGLDVPFATSNRTDRPVALAIQPDGLALWLLTDRGQGRASLWQIMPRP